MAFFDWNRSRAFLHSRKKTLSTQRFSTEFFRLAWGSSRKTWLFRLDLPAQKLGRKRLHLCLEPIASLIQPQNTHPHAHTPTWGTTQQYHTTAPTLTWLSLLLLLAASQRGAHLAPLASSVYHTTAAAHVIGAILPITATPAVGVAALGWVQHHEGSFGGFRLSPMPQTRLDEGSSRAKHALPAKNARSAELPTDFRLPYGSTPSHKPPLGRAQ